MYFSLNLHVSSDGQKLSKQLLTNMCLKKLICLIFSSWKKLEPVFIILGTHYAEGPSLLIACMISHLTSVVSLHYPGIH